GTREDGGPIQKRAESLQDRIADALMRLYPTSSEGPMNMADAPGPRSAETARAKPSTEIRGKREEGGSVARIQFPKDATTTHASMDTQPRGKDLGQAVEVQPVPRVNELREMEHTSQRPGIASLPVAGSARRPHEMAARAKGGDIEAERVIPSL